ncbi:unnamed protein product [Adineta steineri]|uniref:EF-hand domain-containing protein n=1 Tax=Adineta steineri TaxID=433720 RepID=A0A814KU16_9BILA|nr:unnamed protein product [Adineta steineri]
MSIKRTDSKSYVLNRYSNDSTQHTSHRYSSKDNKIIERISSNTQIHANNDNLLKKSQKLIELSKQKRQIPPDKLKLIRHVFNTIMPIERLTDAFLALNYDPQKDITYQDFLIEYELTETVSGLIDFQHFALLVLAYEEKLHLEDEAFRRLDLKIAFECFDINKDGMIDANDLSIIMNILNYPINNQEANEMIEFADHDKVSGLIDFQHFALLVLAYEEKLHLEDEAFRRLDLKIAFECFDINKDGMIDANDLSIIMNILNYPINNQEANEMIEFADHDKDALLSFDEFLTIFTQISTIMTSQ